MNGWRWTAVGTLTLVLAAPAAAQLTEEELVSDRPDFSESTEAVGPGRLQLEAGYAYVRDEGETTHELGQALLRVGLWTDWELRVGLGSWLDGGVADGWDGGSVGVKVHLLDNWQLRPSMALLVGAGTPYGDDDVADDAWQPEAKLALGWELTDALTLGVNGGYARLGEGDDRFDQGQWSASLGWAVTDRLGVFGETFGFTREAAGGDSTQYLDGGATWLLTDDLQLDAWGGTGLGGDAADWFVGTGVVARW